MTFVLFVRDVSSGAKGGAVALAPVPAPLLAPLFIPAAPMLPTHRAGARRPFPGVRLQPWSQSGRFRPAVAT
jgi:hypothetical protein